MPKKDESSPRQTFLAEVRQGQSRSLAAEAAGLTWEEVEEALREPAFAQRLWDAEQEAVRGAIVEAALAGNVPAMHLYFDQRPSAPTSVYVAEVERLAAALGPPPRPAKLAQ